ncbi:MAG: DUF3108 domain-containing protein [Rudaea sp.]
MFVRLAVVAVLNFAAAAGATTSSEATVKPFHADYRVLRNGKAIGRATLSLRNTGDGVWEFDSHTHGTSGMASLLGLDVTEKSTFRWHDGHPQGLKYHYDQSAAIKSRTRDIEFDWENGTAAVRDGKKNRDLTLVPDAVDRSLVTVALMADLQTHAPTLTYHVVHSNKISDEHYSRSDSESIELPAGRVEAVRIERDRSGSKRHTTSWFAPKRAWLPVKIEHVEKHGDTVTLELASQRD